MVKGLKQFLVHAAEEGDGFVMPAPPQIVSDDPQRLEWFGKLGDDGEGAESGFRHGGQSLHRS